MNIKIVVVRSCVEKFRVDIGIMYVCMCECIYACVDIAIGKMHNNK